MLRQTDKNQDASVHVKILYGIRQIEVYMIFVYFCVDVGRNVMTA